MKKLLALLLTLIMLFSVIPVNAEGSSNRTTISFLANKEPLMVYLDLMGVPAEDVENYAAVIAALMNTVTIEFQGQEGDTPMTLISLLMRGQEVFTLNETVENGQLSLRSNLWPNVVMQTAYQDGNAELDSLAAQLGDDMIAAALTWAAGIPCTETTGSFSGNAFDGGNRCVTYSLDDAMLAALVEQLINVLPVGDDSDEDLRGRMLDMNADVARRNEYAYELSIIYKDNELIGLSLNCIHGEDAVLTVSMGFGGSGLRAVVCYGVNDTVCYDVIDLFVRDISDNSMKLEVEYAHMITDGSMAFSLVNQEETVLVSGGAQIELGWNDEGVNGTINSYMNVNRDAVTADDQTAAGRTLTPEELRMEEMMSNLPVDSMLAERLSGSVPPETEQPGTDLNVDIPQPGADIDLSVLQGLNLPSLVNTPEPTAEPEQNAGIDGIDLSALQGLNLPSLVNTPEPTEVPEQNAGIDDIDLSALQGLNLPSLVNTPEPTAAPEQNNGIDGIDLSALQGLNLPSLVNTPEPTAAPEQNNGIDGIDLSALQGLNLPSLVNTPEPTEVPEQNGDIDLSMLQGLDLSGLVNTPEPTAVPEQNDDIDLSMLQGLDLSGLVNTPEPTAAPEPALDLTNLDPAALQLLLAGDQPDATIMAVPAEDEPAPVEVELNLERDDSKPDVSMETSFTYNYNSGLTLTNTVWTKHAEPCWTTTIAVADAPAMEQPAVQENEQVINLDQMSFQDQQRISELSQTAVQELTLKLMMLLPPEVIVLFTNFQ